MLVNLCDYKQSVTLIANSGVQFLDFGLTPQDTASNGRFVRKTANGPLLRLDFDLVNGRYTLPVTGGGQPEVVKPETTIALHQSLTVLDGIWLPVPFLRFNPPRTFVDGPDNWARVQVRKLDVPDAAGNTHRVTLALDSQIAAHEGPESFELSEAWLQDGTPVPPDALTFKLNTLADRRHSGSHYWIDSGSVYLK